MRRKRTSLAASVAGTLLLVVLGAVCVWLFSTDTVRDVTVTAVGVVDVPIKVSYFGEAAETAGHERQVRIDVTGVSGCLRGSSLAGLQVGDHLESLSYRDCLDGPCKCVVEYRKGSRSDR